MQIDELAEIGYVLRGFVRNAGDVIVINEKSRGPVGGSGHFLNIDYRAVGYAADAVKPFPPFSFQVVGGLRLAAQQKVGDG